MVRKDILNLADAPIQNDFCGRQDTHFISLCVLEIELVTLVLLAPCYELSYRNGPITKQKYSMGNICRHTRGMSAMHGIMVTVSLLAVSVAAVF